MCREHQPAVRLLRSLHGPIRPTAPPPAHTNNPSRRSHPSHPSYPHHSPHSPRCAGLLRTAPHRTPWRRSAMRACTRAHACQRDRPTEVEQHRPDLHRRNTQHKLRIMQHVRCHMQHSICNTQHAARNATEVGPVRAGPIRHCGSGTACMRSGPAAPAPVRPQAGGRTWFVSRSSVTRMFPGCGSALKNPSANTWRSAPPRCGRPH